MSESDAESKVKRLMEALAASVANKKSTVPSDNPAGAAQDGYTVLAVHANREIQNVVAAARALLDATAGLTVWRRAGRLPGEERMALRGDWEACQAAHVALRKALAALEPGEDTMNDDTIAERLRQGNFEAFIGKRPWWPPSPADLASVGDLPPGSTRRIGLTVTTELGATTWWVEVEQVEDE